jgi:hypothetical protein
MRSKVQTIYREEGLIGLLLGGTRRILQSSGTLLIHAADRLPATRASLSPNERHLLDANRAFKDKHKGQRCFVIGNGPSLKAQDLSPLANEITFVMSGFWKHPVVEKWQPTYYCFADPLFFDGSEPVKEFMQSLRARIHNTTFFVPLYGAKAIKEQGLLPVEHTNYVNFRRSLSDGRLRSLDLTKFIPGAQSTAQLGIMAAMYMGCSPIYLLGLDHDWLAHRGMDKHFYDDKTIKNHPQAHGDLSLLSYKVDAQAVVNLWSTYEALLQLSSQTGIVILNATNGGFLDVFKRVNYEQLVRK